MVLSFRCGGVIVIEGHDVKVWGRRDQFPRAVETRKASAFGRITHGVMIRTKVVMKLLNMIGNGTQYILGLVELDRVTGLPIRPLKT